MGLYNKKKISKSIIISFAFIITITAIFLVTHIISNANSHKQLNLSHKQLIILNNYLYLEDNISLVPIKDKLETYKTNGEYDKSLINLPASGIKDSDMIEMFKAIENDSVLNDLVAVACIETDIRAVCFVPSSEVDKKGAEAVLVFLGTKALDAAWLDCLEGAYTTDTRLQLEALDFQQQVNNFYNITTVTGHSKGGNLAQYITITNGENIRECISYNGQGFSNLFINKYTENINLESDKITSIISYKEPVNTLLNSIASDTLIIKTDENIDMLSSHVSSYLYDDSFFDSNGDYATSAISTQTKTIKNFDKICDTLVNKIDPKYIEAVSPTGANVLGTLVPMLQDAMAREDVSLLRAFLEEVKKYQANS